MVGRTLERCEKQLKDDGLQAADLAGPSRNVYCWLKFLKMPGHLQQHLDALALARRLLETHWRDHLDIPLSIALVNKSAFYRYRKWKGVQRLAVSQGVMAADEAVWQAIFGNLYLGKSTDRDHVIKAYMAGAQFRDILLLLEAQVGQGNEETSGYYFDLRESFDRVNRRYFNGTMPVPKLKWSRDLTVQKFGHYQAARDVLMLSRTLDQPGVPQYVVDFVMYHELLHKEIDAEVREGRRRIHTSEFRRREKQFAKYEQAKKALSAIAARSRRKRQ